MLKFKIFPTCFGALFLAVMLSVSACSKTEITSELASQPVMQLDIVGEQGPADFEDCGCPTAPRITTGVEVIGFTSPGHGGGFNVKVTALSDCDYSDCELSSKCGCVGRHYYMQFIADAVNAYTIQDFQLISVRDHLGNALNYEVMSNNIGISTSKPFIAKFGWLPNGPTIVPQAASVASGGICIIDVLPDPNPNPDPTPVGTNE